MVDAFLEGAKHLQKEANNMGKWNRVFAFAVTALFLPTVCLAASPWTEQTTYKDKAIGKFEFGIKNLGLGWTELITKPMDHYKEEKTVKNFLMGIKKGICHTVVYTVGGALHLATFPITQIDLPLPQNGVDF
jgi:putative exosortase-associated protein (TIGR04073 family)